MAKTRILSEFMCREMLFDYVTQRLNESDRSSVETALEEYPQLREEIRQLRGALTYCEGLGRLDVSEKLISDLQNRESFIAGLGGRWQQQPRFVRFGFPVILLCAVAILVLRVFIPNWNLNGVTETMTLAKLDRSTPVNGSPQQEQVLQVVPTTTLADSKTLKEKFKETTTTMRAQAISTTSSSSTSTTFAAMVATITPLKTETDAEKSASTNTKRQGFVYRVFVKAKDASRASDKTKEMILGLGGTKAGEVELGWIEPRGYYFHFIIPEKTYDGFIGFIKTLGPVRIQKDRHPRIMPEGEIRFILLVSDQSGKTGKGSMQPTADEQGDEAVGAPVDSPGDSEANVQPETKDENSTRGSVGEKVEPITKAPEAE